MARNSSSSPRSTSKIDATSIKVPSVSSSPGIQQQQLPVSPQPEIPPGERLLGALWRSPDRVHQIGVLDRRNRRFKNLPVDGVTDAVAQAQVISSEGKEVYFACAEYLSPDSRTSGNASGACAFWLDIDCGDDKAAAGKGYPTVNDAKEALGKFCTDAGLPKPTHIVQSGGGLHIYSVVDSVISRETWQSSAKQLKGLTKACGFLADDSRTADIASVLRVPGTQNHKYSPASPVSLEYTADEFIERSVMLDAIAGAHNRLCSAVATKQPGHPPTTKTTTTAIADGFLFGQPELERLSSALATLDPDCDEETWKLKRLAPLALEAHNHPDLSHELYELARSWSSGELGGKPSTSWITPGGNGLTGEEAFDKVWQRFLKDEYTGIPITLGTIYFDAMQVGWDAEEQFQNIDVAVEGNT